MYGLSGEKGEIFEVWKWNDINIKEYKNLITGYASNIAWFSQERRLRQKYLPTKKYHNIL